MTKNNSHWTGESDSAYVHKLGFDFIAQLETKMADTGFSQAKLAKAMGVSEGAVSKMLNNPQNMTLKTIAKYSQMVGVKTAIVVYDDGDPTNQKGLISSQVFTTCWQRAGKPRDLWHSQTATTGHSAANVHWGSVVFQSINASHIVGSAAGPQSNNSVNQPFSTMEQRSA
jgi:transcriptional regulator with XRE-family HTH domain